MSKKNTPNEKPASASSASGISNKKKSGLISSLYQSSQSKTNLTENDLIYKYQHNIPITPEDVLKLNKYTESNSRRIFSKFLY